MSGLGSMDFIWMQLIIWNKFVDEKIDVLSDLFRNELTMSSQNKNKKTKKTSEKFIPS